ncbi:hypothetical protein CYLTODRAFT_446893 [Cylindrobasidium torrendii FP15055 ss-10]|uniref:Uncharacterized protein n=1 Tax=Cylindrobasidium torrendii FP15055 ss-10 TaxID=1314674 RepID=A0A0D7AXN0_9AGAR|nr:hypothetical protein CYLTODRAFT_446893 [Cylindrobasidium torrendii FP15055 ss-10]
MSGEEKALRAQLTRAHKELATYRERLHDIRAQDKKSQAENRELRSERRQLVAELQRHGQYIRELEAQVKALKARTTGMRAQDESLASEIEKLKLEVSGWKGAAGKVQAENNKLRDGLKACEIELAGWKNKHGDAAESTNKLVSCMKTPSTPLPSSLKHKAGDATPSASARPAKRVQLATPVLTPAATKGRAPFTPITPKALPSETPVWSIPARPITKRLSRDSFGRPTVFHA